MRVRLIFECSLCGSRFFRPSSMWTFRDALLKKIGVTPQRCFQCRGRFYLYRPVTLWLFLKTLAGPPRAVQKVEVWREDKERRPETTKPAVSHPAVKTDVVWSTFGEGDQSDRAC